MIPLSILLIAILLELSFALIFPIPNNMSFSFIPVILYKSPSTKPHADNKSLTALKIVSIPVGLIFSFSQP